MQKNKPVLGLNISYIKLLRTHSKGHFTNMTVLWQTGMNANDILITGAKSHQ